jgi:CheY-like chemotaxis protein
MSPNRLTGFTIVVIEGHDDVRNALGGFLRQMGAHPVLAANRDEGLEAINHCLPDLILSDIQVDEIRDFQLLHQKRTPGSGKRGFVPVVVMTPLIYKGETMQIEKAGFSACLRKPFSPKLLMNTILRLTDC